MDLLARLFARLPAFCARPFLYIIAYIRAVVTSRENRDFNINVERVLGLVPGSVGERRFRLQVYYHQGLCAWESLREVYYPGSVSWQGLEEFRNKYQDLMAAGKGVVLVSGHIGAWELLGLSESKLAALAKPSRFGFFNRFLQGFRERMQLQLIWTEGFYPRAIRKAFAAGRGLICIMDQKPESRQGVELDFLGFPAVFPKGPAQFSSQRSAMSFFCVRTGPFQYRLISRVIPDVDCGAEKLTAAFAADIEAVVKAYPEQWCWNYRRWRW